MSKQDQNNLKERAQKIYEIVMELYPEAAVKLKYKSAFQLLIATILSAQCTDEQVNKVTPKLFEKYKDPLALSKANKDELIEIIRSTGFFNNKAKSIIGASQKLVNDFNGKVPDSMEELITLPGVARKTANIILGNYFDKPYGIAIDTHVKRVSQRLGLSKQTNPNKIESDLMKLYEKSQWTYVSNGLIWHGRRICNARKPDCPNCKLSDLCDYFKNS